MCFSYDVELIIQLAMRVSAILRLLGRNGIKRNFQTVPGEHQLEINIESLKSKYLRVMAQRGYIYQCTDLSSLDTLLSDAEEFSAPCAAYLGFDATASCLHVGSLVQIMCLRRLQQAGHKPVVLLGGGTTKIGDPTGKDEVRRMLSDEEIARNCDSIAKIFSKFIKFGDGPTDAVLVNNKDWLEPLKYIEFLREYGTHFTVNRMLSYESVKQRLSRHYPMTFLEFNYMLLQSYDFLQLSRRMKVRLQIGGSDQWGNIIRSATRPPL